MWDRVRHMLIKEFLHVFRDRKMIGLVFIAPLIQIIVFGYAVNTDVKLIPTALYDLDNSPQSRDLAAAFARSGYFRVVANLGGGPEDGGGPSAADDRAADLMDHGRVLAILRMNHGFGAELAAGRTAQLQVIVDGTDSNTAGIVLNYSAKIAAEFSRLIQAQRLAGRGAGEATVPVQLATRAWFNENLESRNFFVPGVIATLVMLITLLLTSMAVVREKELGTMEQVIVTPIRPVEFILGKTLPFALISLVDVLIVTLVAVLWFRVPLRGSPPLLLFCAMLYLMTTLGIGLLVSTVSRTQQQAMITTFFLFFPLMLLSGFMFPIANMPGPIQLVTYVNPLRYFLVILRGIFLKGVGFSVLWPQILALAAMGPVTLFLAARRFHKTMG